MKDRMSTETVEMTISSAASKATYLGSGSALLGWLVTNEAAVLIGILVTVAGFAVNVYYKRKDDQRKQARELRENAALEAYIERLKRDTSGVIPEPHHALREDDND